MLHYTFLISEEFTQELKVLWYPFHLTKSCLMPFLIQARNFKTGLQWADSVSLTNHKQVGARAEQLSLPEIFPWKVLFIALGELDFFFCYPYKIPHFELDTSLRYFSIENINSFPDRVDV